MNKNKKIKKNMKKMMKKTAMLLMLMMVFAAQTLSARSAKDLIDEYKTKDKAEYTYVSPAMMMLAKVAVAKYDKEVGQVLNKVTSVRILTLDACKLKVKKKFNKEVNSFDEEEYQPLVMKDGTYDGFRVLVKSDGEALSEVILLKADYNKCTMIQVEGHIGMDDIQNLVKSTKVLGEK